METIDSDRLKAEQEQIDALIGRGMEFTVPVSGISRLFGAKSERTLEITEPRLGTLDLLADEFIKMELDADRLAGNPIPESNRMVRDHARRMARVVAIAVLNSRCWVAVDSYRGFVNRPLISRYANMLYRSVTPSKLASITAIIRQIMNVGSFINSIRWTAGELARTTQPKADLVEDRQPEETAHGA